jgi:hypothetical protein
MICPLSPLYYSHRYVNMCYLIPIVQTLPSFRRSCCEELLLVQSIARQTIHFGPCTAFISRPLALISNYKCIGWRPVYTYLSYLSFMWYGDMLCVMKGRGKPSPAVDINRLLMMMMMINSTHAGVRFVCYWIKLIIKFFYLRLLGCCV